jgi:hypothetical protein
MLVKIHKFFCTFSAFMQAKDLCPYKENKSKYYLPKKLRGFQEGLDEIEKMPLIKFGAENKGKSNKKDDSTHDKKVVGLEDNLLNVMLPIFGRYFVVISLNIDLFRNRKRMLKRR